MNSQEYDIALDRIVDTENISYALAREKLESEFRDETQPTNAAEDTLVDYKNPPFVARTPEEQARQDAINARGKALGEAALRGEL